MRHFHKISEIYCHKNKFDALDSLFFYVLLIFCRAIANFFRIDLVFFPVYLFDDVCPSSTH